MLRKYRSTVRSPPGLSPEPHLVSISISNAQTLPPSFKASNQNISFLHPKKKLRPSLLSASKLPSDFHIKIASQTPPRVPSKKAKCFRFFHLPRPIPLLAQKHPCKPHKSHKSSASIPLSAKRHPRSDPHAKSLVRCASALAWNTSLCVSSACSYWPAARKPQPVFSADVSSDCSALEGRPATREVVSDWKCGAMMMRRTGQARRSYGARLGQG